MYNLNETHNNWAAFMVADSIPVWTYFIQP